MKLSIYRVYYLIPALLFSNLLFAEVWAGEWIGLEARTSWLTGIHYEQDESGNSTHSLYLSSILQDSITFDLQLGRSTLVDQTGTFDSHAYHGRLGWWISSDINLGLSYSFQGQVQELEIEHYGIALDWNPYPAFLSLQLSRGELFLYARDEIIFRNAPERVQSDIDANTVSLGWWFEHFRLSATMQTFTYELNLRALDRRPLIQSLVKPAALAQTGLLISEQYSIELNYPLLKRDLAWHLLSTRSALDDSETRALQFDWVEPLGKHSSLLLSVYRSDEQQDNWSFGVGLEWNS